MKKKIIIPLITALMCLFTIWGTTTLAAIYGDLTYEISNGEVTITDCDSSVKTVSIPEAIEGYPVTSIGRSAFYYCESLTSVTIPDSVTSIGDYAFYYCSSLTSVSIPDSVISIGDDAFTYCRSLTDINVVDGNKNYSSVNGVLFDKEQKTLIIFPAGKEYTTYEIPDSVTSIGYSAFRYCERLTSISIPESVTSIGKGAFYNCTSLTSVSIPESVTSIGSSAFSYCESLTSVSIPESVTSIGDDAFYSCDSLTDINVVDGNKNYSSVNGVLFDKEQKILIIFPAGKKYTTYEIPDSVTSIGDDAFYDCESLTSVSIPDSVTSIGDGAFYHCGSLTSVSIPDGVTSIGESAFYKCTRLTSVSIPDSVTSIGEDAFDNTGYYNELGNWINDVLYIGKHLVDAKTTISGPYQIRGGTICIADYAFSKCTRLTSISIPESVTSIGDSAFAYCDRLTGVSIPESVTSIGDYAFDNCYSLTSVSIPESVTSIGESAFDSCYRLTSVSIPESVTSIGESAFSSCDSLTTVYYTGTEKQWNEISIGSGNDELTKAKRIYVCRIKFIDDDGKVLKHEVVEKGSVITPPQQPVDKDGYAFDCWEGYTEGMTATENMTFKAVYKYRDYHITIDGVDGEITVTYNSAFKLPISQKEGYNFIGYFTEAEGKGKRITDENGNSIAVYDVADNLMVYPYFESKYLNKIAIEGVESAMQGDYFVESIVFAADKEIYGLVITIRCPEYVEFEKIIEKDFVEIYKDSEVVKDGERYLTFTCLYNYEGDFVPLKEKINPFEIKLKLTKIAELGKTKIDISYANMIGEADYEFIERHGIDFTVMPKLAEEIFINGPDTIELPEKYIAFVMPEHTFNKEVWWSVSDESIATITEDGVLTPVKNGTVTITATAKDGSGVIATKAVRVVTYAKVNTLNFGEGVCLDDFDPYKREYTVYVKKDAESVTLTPTFNGGVLRPNGSGVWFSGRAMKFNLTGQETVITLSRENVTGMENNIYTITVIRCENGTKTTVSQDAKLFKVRPVNAEEQKTIIIALYNGEELVEVKSILCDGEEITYATEKEYTNAKVMVWDSLTGGKPECEAEIIK